MTIRTRNQSLESKSKIPISLKAKMSRNKRNKVKKDLEKFGYKIPNHSREALLLDKKNGKPCGLIPLPSILQHWIGLLCYNSIRLKPSFIRKMVGNMRQCILFLM